MLATCCLTTASRAEPSDTVAADLESAATSIQAGQPRAALEALDAVERIEPQNPWLWFYRGLAHLRLGNAYLAMESFDAALDRLAELGDPDPQLTEAARRYRSQARRQAFSLSWQTGLAYDTNVTYLGNVATGPGLISGRKDGKFASGLQLHYAPVAEEDQALVLNVRLDHIWHFKTSEFNFQDYGASIRYARKLDRRWEASLQYDYDFTLLGNQSFLSSHALTPGLRYHWDLPEGPFRPGTTGVYYQMVDQDFRFPTTRAFDRDGFIHALGVEQSFLFQLLPGSSRTGELTLGYRAEAIPTRGSEFDRNQHNFLVGVGLPLLNPAEPERFLILPDKELLLRFNLHWQTADYDNPSLLDRYKRGRSDFIKSYTWSLSQKLLEHPDYGELTLHGIINWQDARSHLRTDGGGRPFTYDKVIYGMQLEWTW